MQRFLLKGNEMVTEQSYEDAERYFREALKLDSCFADAWNNLGTLYHQRKDYVEAALFYNKAIACDSNFIQGYINRANVHYELNDLDNALEDLARLEKKKPDTVIVHHLKGLVLWKAARYAEASHSFKRALHKGPRDKDVLINIGTLESALKHYDSARYYLRQALELDPAEPNAFNALALMEAENGNLGVAAEWIDKALQKDPANAYFLNNKGYILILTGRTDEALTFINESIAADPGNGWAYRNKGLYYLKKGHPEDAIRLLKQAEERDAHIEKINYFLAEAFSGKGDHTTACQYYAKARERNEITAEEQAKHCE